jgi:hypothetical protein
VGIFLFSTELATERGVTDDYYTDGRVPLVRPSIIISPTEFIPVTDRISLQVKLFNSVVSRQVLITTRIDRKTA